MKANNRLFLLSAQVPLLRSFGLLDTSDLSGRQLSETSRYVYLWIYGLTSLQG